eukprot:4250105-Pyramimonas_sp.AAC.1
MFGQCGTSWPFAMVHIAPLCSFSGQAMVCPPMASAAEDSDGEFDAMEPKRTLLTLSRRDKIKVIEFTDPNLLTCCRLSQLTDKQLSM